MRQCRVEAHTKHNLDQNSTVSWQDQPKVRRGCSKEQRNDCPLLTLGLVLDACGFVRRSEVLAANVSESSTLADLLQALQAPPEAVVVLDKGLATAPNVAWLRELGWHYVLVSRERKRNFDQVEAQAVVTASDSAVRVYSHTDASGETRLHCQSERRQRKEEALVERAGQRLEQALEKLRAGLFPSPRRPSGWRRSGSGSGACARNTRKPRRITRSRSRRTLQGPRRSG